MDLSDFVADINFRDHEALLIHKPCGKSFDMPVFSYAEGKDITLKDINDCAYGHECPKEE